MSGSFYPNHVTRERSKALSIARWLDSNAGRLLSKGALNLFCHGVLGYVQFISKSALTVALANCRFLILKS